MNRAFLYLHIVLAMTSFHLFSSNPENEDHKKIVYLYPCFWGHNVFNPQAENRGFYDLEPFYKLHKVAAEKNYDLRECDFYMDGIRDRSSGKTPTQFDLLVVFEVADWQQSILSTYPSDKLVLFLWEPSITMPINYFPQKHRIFSRVYTWNDEWVDNQKYFKLFYPVLRSMRENKNEFKNRKLCVFVGGNKSSWVENELYSERRKVIDFFEEHHPNDFDFYGGDWDEGYQTYRGKIEGNLDTKIETLKGYRFSIAYENGKNIPGYVSEKIFDCFAAGIVPVYYGASNITSYIPKNCFISREDFKNTEELYEYLSTMKQEEYEKYIQNIQLFLKSEQAQLFSSDNFVRIMMDMLLQIDKKKTEKEKSSFTE
jgi:hypothetical protein